MDPHVYSQPIFDKGTEGIQWRKDCGLFFFSQQMVLGQRAIHMGGNHGLKVKHRCKTCRDSKDDLGFGDNFLDRTPRGYDPCQNKLMNWT